MITDFHTCEWAAQARIDSLRDEASVRRTLRLLNAAKAPSLIVRLWQRLTGKAHRDQPAPA
ncbi:hypothetical protein [Deinococcus sp.]|uniref:hypothetical protein n=1 Tax=Deinococcus sp. TaxID=47478 RepID=UPI0025E3A2A0|nr:hypothetical protein [Deinococcus sp.]